MILHITDFERKDVWLCGRARDPDARDPLYPSDPAVLCGKCVEIFRERRRARRGGRR